MYVFVLFGTALFLLDCLNEAAMMNAMVSGPKCSEFCPPYCKNKCNGVEARSVCNGEACHCECPSSAVDCKEDECHEFCEKHSGGRVFKSVCMKAHVCKCAFGDPEKEGNMNPMTYPITSDVRTEVQIIPE